MSNLTAVISKNFNPYKNLAMEKFLLENVTPGRVFLYLWQNERTVVCGRNQNIWKECRVKQLLEDGGYPARRLSGGGAVFHDLGNLNFTFIACGEDYDLEKQLKVIIKACKRLGIEAERSGRNDITACGAKFSGNAFYKANPGGFEDKVLRRYHHGTLMVDVDKEGLSSYLNTDKEKYESKGVDSVKSRVVNLKELNPALTVCGLAAEMVRAFGKVYGGEAGILDVESGTQGSERRIWNKEPEMRSAADGSLLAGIQGYANAKEVNLTKDQQDYIDKTAEFFASDGWLYRNNIKFNVRFCRRFGFGDFDLRLYVEKGIIKQCALYSDAMDEEAILEVSERLKETEGMPYGLGLLEEAIGNREISNELLK